MDTDCPTRSASPYGGLERKTLGGYYEFLETQRPTMGFSRYTR